MIRNLRGQVFYGSICTVLNSAQPSPGCTLSSLAHANMLVIQAETLQANRRNESLLRSITSTHENQWKRTNCAGSSELLLELRRASHSDSNTNSNLILMLEFPLATAIESRRDTKY
ncbi:unnamed protein product [Diplocarpon coronariae]